MILCAHAREPDSMINGEFVYVTHKVKESVTSCTKEKVIIIQSQTRSEESGRNESAGPPCVVCLVWNSVRSFDESWSEDTVISTWTRCRCVYFGVLFEEGQVRKIANTGAK